MSLLIKGVEMPKHCAACPIERLDDYGDKIAFYCLLNDGDTKQVRAKCRRPDCPLVPVPPHGRLGDLGKLKERVTKHLDASNHGSLAEAYFSALIDLIDTAPTIIPAEEGEP